MSVPLSSLRFHLLLRLGTALQSSSILASGWTVMLTAAGAFSQILSLKFQPLSNTTKLICFDTARAGSLRWRQPALLEVGAPHKYEQDVQRWA